MQAKGTKRSEGIDVRHSRSCELRRREGETCTCTPRYQAMVWSQRERKQIKRTFAKLSEAKAWRAESQTAVRKGTMKAPTPVTLNEAAEAWLTAAKAGIAKTRSGDPYKPSAIRSYEAALRQRVLPDLGGLKLCQIDRRDIQALAERLEVEGLSPSTIRNVLMPLRAIFRRAVRDNVVTGNPTTVVMFRRRRFGPLGLTHFELKLLQSAAKQAAESLSGTGYLPGEFRRARRKLARLGLVEPDQRSITKAGRYYAEQDWQEVSGCSRALLEVPPRERRRTLFIERGVELVQRDALVGYVVADAHELSRAHPAVPPSGPQPKRSDRLGGRTARRR